MNAQTKSNKSIKSAEEIVYEDAFAFIMGRVKDLEVLGERHSTSEFQQIDKAEIYLFAENTCRKVLQERKVAAWTLSAFVDARYMLCLMADSQCSGKKHTDKDTFQKMGVEQLVFNFVQSQISIEELNAGLEKILCTDDSDRSFEKVLLESMEQARRDILLETAVLLNRCDLLREHRF